MNRSKSLIHNAIILIACGLFSGCLKDEINLPDNVYTDNGFGLLRYFEARGDYINSDDAPSLVDAAEVYSNLNNYLIIDMRTPEEFMSGHIDGAKNIINTELLNYLQSNDLSGYNKIVNVSANGQASAYYTCLLRLYGFNNIYTMNFGMAYWNRDFADDWMQNIKNSPNIRIYDNIEYPKGQFAELPIVFEKSEENIDEFAKQRIASFITRGFVDKLDNITDSDIDIGIGQTMYLVCYGTSTLYLQQPVREGTHGHPPNAIFYSQSGDLRSTQYLQTLPSNKEILIYDFNGQLSAAVIAYLQVMGYPAKSLLYGACQIIYNRMSTQLPLAQYAFLPERINNFPYVTGQ